MSVNRNQLQILIRDLGAIPPSVRKTLRPAILKAGRPVLDRMRANASWSTRIPAAITMRASTTSPGIRFRVDSARAPHARPIEHDGEPGTFRHPVYGNREVWRDQPARPFFYRAVEAYADQITDRLGEAVMDAAREHGF
jgi:hypothetical protein